MKVYLEVGQKKLFAVSIAWPGWARSGKTEEAALDALGSYAPRFAEVAKAAGLRFPQKADVFEVTERVTGDATTDFGAPSMAIDGDERMTAAEVRNLTALLTTSWELLDRQAAESPQALRKGPRGGGRDRDKMLGHVLDSEAAYARKIGVKHKPPALGDTEAIAALRSDILAALRAGGSSNRRSDPKAWPVRYAGRRFVWHVLDHLWEMQDRIM
jgi:hypothetical protein